MVSGYNEIHKYELKLESYEVVKICDYQIFLIILLALS